MPRMLMARGRKLIGGANLRWALVFTARLWCIAVERDGLVLDTRFVPASTEAARGTWCLYLLLKGAFEIHGPAGRRFEAPSAFVLSDEQLEGARGSRPFTFTAGGRPFTAIELHVRAADVTVEPSALPAPVTLDERTWNAARAIARLGDDDDTLRSDVAALVEGLASLGLVARAAAAATLDGTPKPFVLLWKALRPMIERLYLTPTLQEVGDATDVSSRQIERYAQDFVASFALVGHGWRPATRHLRLKLATILLSAESASVAEVASLVGYRSSDAMARAFRDAGMPAPAVVQERVRALV